MKTKNLIKSLTLALGIVAGASAFAAGDIYEIRPWENGTNRTAWATIDKPLTSGETVYFNVRLIQRDMGDTNSIWYVNYGGMGSIETAKMFPMQIGIYVSGELRYADLVESTAHLDPTAPYNITDLVFAYTTKPGDFALPVVLATSSGPVTSSSDSNEFLLANYGNDKWKVVNKKNQDLQLSFHTTVAHDTVRPQAAPTRSGDYTLRDVGIYIQTVDFDDEWATSESGYWRIVHQDSTTIYSGGAMPSIVASAPVASKVTYHVWSDDETAVKIEGGTTRTMTVGYSNASGSYLPVTKTVQVGDITIVGGNSYANFRIYGVESNKTANLILSPWADYSYIDSTDAYHYITNFVTVPVKCTIPLPPSVSVTPGKTIVYATTNYLVSVAALSVTLSAPYAGGDFNVKITPSFQNIAVTDDIGEFLRLSTESDDYTLNGTLPTTTEATVTFEGGAPATKTVYLFALGGERGKTYGTGNQILFTPSTDDAGAAAAITTWKVGGLFLDSTVPVIESPVEEAPFSAIAGEPANIEIKVADTYLDTKSVAGYTVQVRYKNATDTLVTLSGTYKPDSEGVLRSIVDGNTLPALTYPISGSYDTVITVKSPVSGKTSAVRTIAATVAAPKTVTVVTTDGKDGVYKEGDKVEVQVTLSDINDTGVPLYAFLRPDIANPADVFGGKTSLQKFVVGMTDCTGLKINPNSYTSSKGNFVLLDGWEDYGFQVSFEVVLCTTPTYDESAIVSGYSSNILVIFSDNIEPVIGYIDMNDGSLTEYNGYAYENAVPKGQEQNFKIYVRDIDYDLRTNFQYRVQIKRGSSTVSNATYSVSRAATETDIHNFPFKYNFPRAGEYTIKVSVLDKDMSDWSTAPNYSFSINALDNPSVAGSTSSAINDTFNETDKTAKLHVKLDYFDSDIDYPIVVKLTIEPPSADVAKAGRLVLDSSYKTIPDPSPAGAYDPLNDNEYYVSFTDAGTEEIPIVEMNGTDLSSSKGFKVKAEVVTQDVNPKTGDKWSDYYILGNGNPWKVYIEDVAPNGGDDAISFYPDNGTNVWRVAGGLVSEHPLTWYARTDVDWDWTNGVTVTIMGANGSTYNEDGFVNGVRTLHEPTRGTFIPNFGNAQGDQVVTIMIEDADGGSVSHTWYFFVTPSKFLTTISHGPNGGVANNPLSTKYNSVKLNLGQGHTFVNDSGVSYSGATSWRLDWNCGKRESVTALGYGYKTGTPIPSDDGTLNGGNDIALNTLGGTYVSPAAYYTYPDAEFDSYLYAWIISEPAADAASRIWNLSLSPVTETRGASDADVPLPTELTGDESYVKVFAEAVFSREWRAADNCGDINADGVPDICLTSEWGGGSLLGLIYGGGDAVPGMVTGGDQTLTTYDLQDIGGQNPDNERLPGYYSANNPGVNVSDEAKASYAPVGVPFTVRMQIRGLHLGLNATDLTTSDIDLSEDEALARAYWYYTVTNGTVVYNGMAVADFITAYPTPEDLPLSVWTPEPGNAQIRRMDPTMEDTDGDGFPDGWEYFFWYQAKVWRPTELWHRVLDDGVVLTNGLPRAGQTFMFERFSYDHVIYGTEITLDEVLARFDPCVDISNAYAENPDFDNDGLSDLEELALGTNPCHWDTDGDHINDAWEVMMLLDPLNPSYGGNADGDFMALLNMPGPGALFYDGATTDLADEDALAAAVAGGTAGNFYYVATPPAAEDPLAADYHARTVLRFNASAWTLPGATAPSLVKYGRTDGIPRDHLLPGWGSNLAVNRTQTDTIPAGAVQVPFNIQFVFIHRQVYDAFGFDPRTGWFVDRFGFLAERWDPPVPGDPTGQSINTRTYSNYDEYLVMLYRRLNGENPDVDDMWARIAALTTNPSLAHPTITENETANAQDEEGETGDNEMTAAAQIAERLAEAFAQIGSSRTPVVNHGADTDGDGVPDGWELYVGGPRFNPNVFPDPVPDSDLDGLSDLQEYPGTDSCNAYSGCPTIFEHHPGNANGGRLKTGWFNKFFPTDPYDPDTDADGISDGDEGDGHPNGWLGDFYNGGNVYPAPSPVWLTFIYGNPVDDGSRCIRGGGSNPCTIDTDQDGIPDLWEREHAGVRADAVTRTCLTENAELDAATFIADGLNENSEPLPTEGADGNPIDRVYIAGGMDATFPFDVGMTTGGPDPRTGTVRDMDFDHDGLQNYQEYLIQTVRHYRYDDTVTPLMGRVITLSTTGNNSQEFYGYVPFNASSAEDFVDGDGGAREAWADDAAHVAYATARANLPDDDNTSWTMANWRRLGYFAEPQRGWDMSIQSEHFGALKTTFFPRQPIYLMPPSPERFGANIPLGHYLCTDPRIADTDADGMDDYWEVFHGLNPILGSSVTAPSSGQISSGKSGDIIAATYMSAMVSNLEDFNAYKNAWVFPSYDAANYSCTLDPIAAPQCYDPILYPWIMGTALADADGDGIRNDHERVFANGADPLPTHTDPTPLWFTEHTTPVSYTAQYYWMPPMTPLMFNNNSGEGGRFSAAAAAGSSTEFMFGFEEGEGYDTDRDTKPDGHEIVQMATRTTDPLKFSDPDRRQALWFPGRDSFAMTRTRQYREMESSDFFKQFTVECWINPDRVDQEQTVIERSCIYPGDAITADGGAIRANFRIGIASDGIVYGMFDNNDSIESGLNQPASCQRVDGQTIASNKWTHVALTFDGAKLSIYVNGYLVQSAETKLIPASGVMSEGQNIAAGIATTGYDNSLPCALFIGARPKVFREAGDTVMQPDLSGAANRATVFARYKEFYAGYVDEVRIWDGARDALAILADFNKRYKWEDVEDNRTAVYEIWNEGGTRNNNDGNLTLPPELVYHFNFQSLPGAVNSGDVALTPPGFTARVLGAATSNYSSNEDIDPTGLYPNEAYGPILKGGTGGSVAGNLLVGWWNNCATHSEVYRDYHVIPWIHNTVEHLPLMDGSTPDTFRYNENYGAAYTPAAASGVTRLVFPNTAQPYSSLVYGDDRAIRLATANNLSAAFGEVYADLFNRYGFWLRSRIVGTSDLLPMGQTYAKTCPELWDGATADAWEYTRTDRDADGLPDWWENYARGNYCRTLPLTAELGWDTIIDYHGSTMPAYRAYLIDLAQGMQPSSATTPVYASIDTTLDDNGNGLPDWWEKAFLVQDQAATDDPDNDGLSNYQEYLISYGPAPYGITNGWPLLDPNQMRSNPELYIPDYFTLNTKGAAFATIGGDRISVGEYAGEVVTDHDFIETWWERQFNNGFVSIIAYDPDLDTDEDGWDNWSEARSATWYGTILSDTITKYLADDVILDNYPRPAIGVKATYHGAQNVTGSALVVRTIPKVSGKTDATFVINAGGADQVGTGTMINGAFLDMNTPMHGFLQPGCVIPTSCRVTGVHLSKDAVYFWGIAKRNSTEPRASSGPWVGTNETSWASSGRWIGDKIIDEVDCWYYTGTFEQYRADYRTYGKDRVFLDNPELDWENVGAVRSKDDGRMGEFFISSADTSSQAVFGTLNFETGEYVLNPLPLHTAGLVPEGMLVRMEYQYKISTEWPQTLWFNQPIQGRVKQGIHTIEAFLDLNDNGDWDVGEPYGMVQNVDIGWHKVPELKIEMLDNSPVVRRGFITAGQAEAAQGEDEQPVLTGQTTDVIIRRRAINGEQRFGEISVPNRILASQTFSNIDRLYLTEADVLNATRPDLDWKWLASDARKLSLTTEEINNVTYGIYRIDVAEDGTKTETLITSFDRAFSYQRPVPVATYPASGLPVYVGRPTFRFTSSDSTMTAYRLQVLAADDDTVVYDSGDTILPAKTGWTVDAAAYEVNPELYVDTMTTTNMAVFADGKTYKWRVALMNAKFCDVEDESAWSDWATFKMDVRNVDRDPYLKTGYGEVSATVRYYGPYTNSVDNLIVVEAWDNADFTGLPLMRTRVADVSNLRSTGYALPANAVLRGIRPGIVYLTAYIDINNNGKRDAWESWGYANYVGTSMLSIYTPQGATVSIDAMVPAKLDIFIEDTDVNRNEWVDVIEVMNGTADFTTTDLSATDSDGDGLPDTEESQKNADPMVWDTDDDGMPDGWEAYAELDPSYADASEAATGDVMAFAVVPARTVTITNTLSGVKQQFLYFGNLTPQIGDNAEMLTNELYATYSYPVVNQNTSTNYFGLGLKAELSAAAGSTNRVLAIKPASVALVHWQVYDKFGYDPTTANPVAFEAGTAANTKAFTALDKYLVCRYLAGIGVTNSTETLVNKLNKWNEFTLRPYETDGDMDGIADGWELYVMFARGADPQANWTAGTIVSPWKYDDRDAVYASGLTLLEEYDRGNSPTDPWAADTNDDGISDKLAYKYHLKGSRSVDDEDRDGLSNYAEYLLTEVFNVGATFDPDNAYSVDPAGIDSDYFFKVGSTYVGQIFTDHDFMEDAWERVQGSGYSSPWIWDATSDADEDGWSAFAECRYNSSVSSIKANRVSHMLGDMEMKDFPVPTLKLNLRYNLSQILRQNAEGENGANEEGDANTIAPLIVQTYTDNLLRGTNNVADATFNATFGENLERQHFLGSFTRETISGSLTPGHVNLGSFALEFAYLPSNDMIKWSYTDPENPLAAPEYYRTTYEQYVAAKEALGGEAVTMLAADFEWSEFTDKAITVTEEGKIRMDGEPIGKVNAQTGEFSINLTTLEHWIVEPTNGTSAIAMEDAVYRIRYTAQLPTLSSDNMTLYLGEANQGYVREGKNNIVAFFDLDGSGNYTPGEPLGYAHGVDVGWYQGEATIELTDTSPVLTRIGIESGETDRVVLYGIEDGDRHFSNESELSGGRYQRLRVIRSTIDGYSFPDELKKNPIVDKMVNLDQKTFLFEGDVLSDTEFDLDWSGFKEINENPTIQNNKGRLPFTNLVYTIILGNGSINGTAESNKVLSVAVSRSFDGERRIPTTVSPGITDAILYKSHPTFKWNMERSNTYTAFRLQILDSTATTVVWDSGLRHAPARDSEGNYFFEAPAFAKCELTPGTHYTWRVSMYNSKFQDDAWSQENPDFLVNTPEAGVENGAINVSVRYFGPTTVTGDVIVEAFTNPDFTGTPASRAKLSLPLITTFGAPATVNATLIGLAPGDYYVRAFIDSPTYPAAVTLSDSVSEQANPTIRPANVKRDAFEPWGYYCPRSGDVPFKPAAVTISDSIGKSDTIPVYIEDVDGNGNNLPDEWEMSVNGGALYKGAEAVDSVLRGNVATSSALATLALLPTPGGESSGLIARAQRLSSPAVAAMVVGAPVVDVDSIAATVNDATEIVEGTIAITSLSLDASAKKVNLTVSADVDNSLVNSSLSAIYKFTYTGTLEVTCIVDSKASLDEPWTEACRKRIVIGGDAAEVSVDLGDDVDLTKGFYKIRMEK